MRLAPLACLVLLAGVALPASAAFDASFAPKAGNSWWVEVAVTANEPLAGVDARFDAGSGPGAWIQLEKKSWGTWAKSFHVPDGSRVEFRARAQGGATDQSGAYIWPQATPAAGQEFTASFAPKPGNAWWVETGVAANQPLAGVDARVEGGTGPGPWTALEKKSWGSWAKSFHVPDGSIITFRARANSGETVVSGGYRWPEATPVPENGGDGGDGGAGGGGGGGTPPAVDIAFGPKAGNAWWVETYAIANSTVLGVEARVDGGSWQRLTLRDWGAWATSMHAPAGSRVEFRGQVAAGTDQSVAFTWPQAHPVGAGAAWPAEGAYARFTTHSSDPEPSTTTGTWTIIRHDGAWWSRHDSVRDGASGTTPQSLFCPGHQYPHGPTSTFVGAQVAVEVEACSDHAYQVTVKAKETSSARQDGRLVTFTTWSGSRIEPSCSCIEWKAEWDTATGLVASASQAGLRSGTGFELVDTDAPLARTS